MSVAALGLVFHAPQTSEAPFHGIGLAKGCNSPIVIGQVVYLTC